MTISTTATTHESASHPACEPCDTEQTSPKTNTKSKNRQKKSTQAKDCPTGDCGSHTVTVPSNGFAVPIGNTGEVFYSVWRFGE